MDDLAAHIPIRVMPSPGEILLADEVTITKVGSWLGLQLSMDEYEDEELSGLPHLVKAALNRLVHFKYQGYVSVNNDNIDRLARIFSRGDIFVSHFSFDRTHLKIEGYRTKNSDLEEYLQINLDELLTTRKPSGPGLNFSVPISQFTPPTGSIESTVGNVRKAIQLQDSDWQGKLKVTRTAHALEFSAKATSAHADMVLVYLREKQGYHQVTTLETSSYQNPLFILPFLEKQLRSQLSPEIITTLYDLELQELPDSRYLLQYRTTEPDNIELLDLILRKELDRLLTEDYELRYFLPSQNILGPIFQALEDLVPTANGLISPYDRQLQKEYALIQGYKGIHLMLSLIHI